MVRRLGQAGGKRGLCAGLPVGVEQQTIAGMCGENTCCDHPQQAPMDADLV